MRRMNRISNNTQLWDQNCLKGPLQQPFITNECLRADSRFPSGNAVGSFRDSDLARTNWEIHEISIITHSETSMCRLSHDLAIEP